MVTEDYADAALAKAASAAKIVRVFFMVVAEWINRIRHQKGCGRMRAECDVPTTRSRNGERPHLTLHR
jgi:hypothetical protein